MTRAEPTRLSIRILLLLALLAVLSACRQQTAETPTIEPAGTPTAAATSAAPTPAPAADAWATVQARGRLVVGTSADYPPFAFYTEEFGLDGFDIALARALGEQLGVAVEFNDMAFDGLGGALQVGQIDAAIAAISVSESRAASSGATTSTRAGDRESMRPIHRHAGPRRQTATRRSFIANGVAPTRPRHATLAAP